METIGVFEAKTEMADLLDRVAKGGKITITRHGIPAAVLVPVAETETKLSHGEIIEGMRSLRKRVKPDPMSARKMIKEGRTF